MAVCPNCGSHNFRYELRSAGTRSTSNYYRTGIKNSWIVPAGQKKYNSNRKQQAVGICPDCGYIEEKQEKGCAFYLLCFLFLPISLSLWFYKSNAIKIDKKWKALILACFWVLFFIISGTTGQGSNATRSNATSAQATSSVWRREYTDLSDFDYYIDGSSIVLKEYNGSAKQVSIAPAYTVDSVEMPVVALDGTFTLHSVSSVIVPEGVTQIVNNTFNSCGIKYLYLPSSLTDFPGWSYFHSMEKIYYGGTEEQWSALYTDERSRLDVVQIVCNAKVDDLLTK